MLIQSLVLQTKENRDIHNHKDFCVFFVGIQVVLVANVMSENHLDCLYLLDVGKARLIKPCFAKHRYNPLWQDIICPLYTFLTVRGHKKFEEIQRF